MDPSIIAMIMQMMSKGGGGQQAGGQGYGGMSHLGGLLGGLFGNSGAPYGDAMKQFQKHFGDAQGYQKPFYEAGTNAIGNYQDWLKQMKDPSGFINQQMDKYQESPWSQNLQREAMRAGTNMGSATGMSGSTPLMQQMQQNAGNIASSGQNDWLSHVLGVNTQYGAGQQGMVNMGQNAANSMSTLSSRLAELMGQGAYGQRAGKNQDFMSILSSLFG